MTESELVDYKNVAHFAAEKMMSNCKLSNDFGISDPWEILYEATSVDVIKKGQPS